MSSQIQIWQGRLDRLARAVLSDLPDPGGSCDRPERRAAIDGFSDESGVRRAIDSAVLGRVFGVPPGPMPEDATPDLQWWWALAAGGAAPVPEPSGPLTRRREDQGIELWTEIELGALHAAWSLAIDREDEPLLARCMDACRWHIAELQPDNATNHAWAIHAFVIYAGVFDCSEADLHAQTLLHACMMTSGKPDRFSGLLMYESADALETWLSQREWGQKAFE